MSIYTGIYDRIVINKESTYGTPDKDAAKAISAITAANPAVVTCAAHGLTVGVKHFVYFSGVTTHADAATALNGRYFIAVATDATTYTLTNVNGSGWGGAGTDGNVYSFKDASHHEQYMNGLTMTLSMDPQTSTERRIGDERVLSCQIDGIMNNTGTITGHVVSGRILKLPLGAATTEAGNAYEFNDGDTLEGYTVFAQGAGNSAVVLTGCKFGVARIPFGSNLPMNIELDFIGQNLFDSVGFGWTDQVKPEDGNVGTCQPLMGWNGVFEYNNTDYIIGDGTITINNNLVPDTAIEDTISGNRYWAAITEGNFDVTLDGSVKVESEGTLMTDLGYDQDGVSTSTRSTKLIELDFISTVSASADRTALIDLRECKLTLNEINPRGDIETRFFRMTARAKDIKITGAYI